MAEPDDDAVRRRLEAAEADNKEIQAATTFKAEAPSGTVKVSFKFSAVDLAKIGIIRPFSVISKPFWFLV